MASGIGWNGCSVCFRAISFEMGRRENLFGLRQRKGSSYCLKNILLVEIRLVPIPHFKIFIRSRDSFHFQKMAQILYTDIYLPERSPPPIAL